MPRLALPRLILLRVLVAQSAARTNDHCSCHSVKSKTFTRLMYERGFRAAAAHRAPSNLKLSPPPRRDLIKPVLEELWRSLRAERRQVTTADDAARELARALNETGDWVLVYENRVYVGAPVSKRRTADERELVVGRKRGRGGAALAGRDGRGAARRDGPKTPRASELTVLRVKPVCNRSSLCVS